MQRTRRFDNGNKKMRERVFVWDRKNTVRDTIGGGAKIQFGGGAKTKKTSSIIARVALLLCANVNHCCSQSIFHSFEWIPEKTGEDCNKLLRKIVISFYPDLFLKNYRKIRRYFDSGGKQAIFFDDLVTGFFKPIEATLVIALRCWPQDEGPRHGSALWTAEGWGPIRRERGILRGCYPAKSFGDMNRFVCRP